MKIVEQTRKERCHVVLAIEFGLIELALNSIVDSEEGILNDGCDELEGNAISGVEHAEAILFKARRFSHYQKD